jgi:hypothetical protein
MANIDIKEAAEFVGLTLADVDFLRTPPPEDLDEAQWVLAEFKKKLRSAFRERAKQLHPDKGGDPADFRKLKELYDEFNSIKITRHQPQPEVVVIYNGFSTYGGTSSTTTSTAYW